MEHLKLVFEDIMQPKILFYDTDYVPACMKICDYLKIDNLPAIDGRHFLDQTECRSLNTSYCLNTNSL